MKWTTPSGQRYTFHCDLLAQKHLMIAGASGSGKSVLLNGMIWNALYNPPGDIPGGVQFILIDQKGMELTDYRRLPHTIKYATVPAESIEALRYAVQIMDSRNKASSRQGVKMYQGGDLYIIIDEFADLMTTCKKQIVPLVQRIAQLGRAAKVHIILCTQVVKTEILPTIISCNFDSRIGLHTASAKHSRLIIEAPDCAYLPQYGECIYMKPGQDPTHYTGIPLFTDEQIAERVKWWTDQNKGLFTRLFNRTA